MLGANLVSSAAIAGVSALKNGIGELLSGLNSASATWKTFDANMKNIGMPTAQIAQTKKELQKFAQETIYSASDMSSTYSQLAAVGTKNTTQLVKGFGGLASAADDPAQAMKTLSQQATQMAAKPKVQWEDFKLMLEQSPAGMAAVAKTMGKSTGQLVKDIQASKVSTDDFFNAVTKAGNSPAFAKMATQYKTVGQATDGLIETLTNKLQPAFDSVSQVGIDAISKLTDYIGGMDFTGFAKSAVSALDNVVNAIIFVAKHADEFKALAIGVTTFLVAFKAVSFVTHFSQTLTAAKTVAEGLVAALGVGPWGLLAAAVAALAAGLVYFFTQTKTGQKAWSNFVSWIEKAAAPLATAAKALVEMASNGLAKLGPMLVTAGNAIKAFISAGLAKIGPLLDSMGGAFGKVGALIGPVISIITKLGLAALGITGPWGLLISVIASFLGMWAKTGQLNSNGITTVFANLNTMIQNVAATISKYLPQIVAIGTQLLASLIQGIAAALPTIFTAATSIINALVQGIVVVLPMLITLATQLLTTLVNGIVAALPAIITVGVQILTTLIAGILTVIPLLIGAALQLIMALFNGLVAALPQIITAGLQIVDALVSGLISMLPTLISAAVELILTLAGALIANLPKIISAGVELLIAVATGLLKMIPTLVSAAFQIVVALFGALVANAPKILSAGVSLVKALIQGLLQLIGEVGSAAIKLGLMAIKGIGSIAKDAFNAGIDFVKGFIGGIGSMVGSVVDAAANIGKKAVDSVKSSSRLAHHLALCVKWVCGLVKGSLMG